MSKKMVKTGILGICVLALQLAASAATNEWAVAKSTTFANRWANAPVGDATVGAAETLEIDVRYLDQKILGFGAAVSEQAWRALSYLSEGDRKTVLDELFSAEGGNLSVMRLPFGSSAAALDYYSYDDRAGDFGLEEFSIAHDEATILPLLREIVRRVPGERLRIWASPWCPPRWMKTTGCYASCPLPKGAQPNDCLPGDRVYEGEDGFRCDERHFKTYARYFQMALAAFRAQGVPIWMVMPQNAVHGDLPSPSCTWTAQSLAAFLGRHLGPALEGPGTELHLGTVDRASMDFVNTVLKDADCARYVKGVGFQGEGRKAVVAVRKRRPDLPLSLVELEPGTGTNDWRQARACWEQLRHYLSNGVAFCDYGNLALSEGGRVRWDGRQNSLLSVSAENGRWRFNIDYFILKHVSRYVMRGAMRVLTEGYADSLVFVNPDKSIVVVLGNETDAPLAVPVDIDGRSLVAVLPAHSVSTFVVR